MDGVALADSVADGVGVDDAGGMTVAFSARLPNIRLAGEPTKLAKSDAKLDAVRAEAIELGFVAFAVAFEMARHAAIVCASCSCAAAIAAAPPLTLLGGGTLIASDTTYALALTTPPPVPEDVTLNAEQPPKTAHGVPAAVFTGLLG